MESNDIASCIRWSLSPYFLFCPSADTREQHPTSMTCDTRRSDDDDDSNNNNPFPCRHHQAGVTSWVEQSFLPVCPVPERPPSVKPCRATLDSGKPRASSATHKQQATRPVHSLPLSRAISGTQGSCSPLRPSTRGARQLLGSTGIVAFVTPSRPSNLLCAIDAASEWISMLQD